jgi:hypothetical protein
MEFPINESSVVLVVATIPTTLLIGMMLYFAISGILGKSSKQPDASHFSRG